MLNIKFVSADEWEIKQAHISAKYNSKRELLIIINYMITNKKKLALYTDHSQVLLTIS